MIYTTQVIRTWAELLKFFEKTSWNGRRLSERCWIFRGQGDSDWELATSLEREFIKTIPKAKDNHEMEEWKKLAKVEEGLLRHFQRESQQYIKDIPKEESKLEWLALMQHHGAPTRLFDWTYSFFVALYFAIEQSNGECAVWALNQDSIDEGVKLLVPNGEFLLSDDQNARKRETFFEIFESGIPLVCPIIPFHLNQRLIIQQGLFLCPGDVTKPFMENLKEIQAVISLNDKKKARENFLKIVIKTDPEQKREVIQRLFRMNMNRAVLFPGLDGYAQSLKTLMFYEEINKPKIGGEMSFISHFFGITIYMDWKNRGKPYFEAKYAGVKIKVDIENGSTRKIEGKRDMSSVAMELIEKWRKVNKVKLLDCWENKKKEKSLFPVEPLK